MKQENLKDNKNELSKEELERMMKRYFNLFKTKNTKKKHEPLKTIKDETANETDNTKNN